MDENIYEVKIEDKEKFDNEVEKRDHEDEEKPLIDSKLLLDELVKRGIMNSLTSAYNFYGDRKNNVVDCFKHYYFEKNDLRCTSLFEQMRVSFPEYRIPTLMEPEYVDAIVNLLRNTFKLGLVEEITKENDLVLYTKYYLSVQDLKLLNTFRAALKTQPARIRTDRCDTCKMESICWAEGR